jgi:hypothetical protein
VSEIRAVLSQINVSNVAAAVAPFSPLEALLENNNSTSTTSTVAKSLKLNETTASYDNDNGIAVHVRLRMFGYAHHHCQIICTLADANGKVVIDPNGRMVQIATDITPGFDDTNYYNDPSQNIEVHFASSQIHGAVGNEVNKYSFLVSVRDAESGTWITTAARQVNFAEKILNFNELINN